MQNTPPSLLPQPLDLHRPSRAAQVKASFSLSDFVHLTAEGLRQRLSDYMPESAFHDFYSWSYSDKNPDRRVWLQTVGLEQLVQLTLKLYGNLVSSEELARLVELAIPINVYQVYEIVSDNIAIGLARQMPGDETYTERWNLIHQFNLAMVARLQRQPTKPATETLAPFSLGISTFKQSLSPQKHYAIAQQYLHANPEVSEEELEYAALPLLGTNIEACAEVVQFMSNYQVGPIVHRGLVRRYQAVNALLNTKALSIADRTEASQDAILVSPIFAYYLGILCETVRPLKHWPDVIENQLLPDALLLSALLIRIINDMGTNLVTCPADQQAAFVNSLRRRLQPNLSFSDVLKLAVLDNALTPTFLTRIRKDLDHGEFNLSFSDLLDLPPADALEAFEQRLTYYSRLYARSRIKLTNILAKMTQTLKDDVASQVIYRIVTFHEQLYSNAYTKADGEYAV